MAKFQIFQDDSGEYRWHLRADNNEIVAASEGYTNKSNCEHGIDVVKKLAKRAEVKDLTK